MLDRRDAPGRMLSLRQLMDRLFEDAFVMPQDLMSRVSGTAGGGAMDVYEEGDYLVVEAQLPGMKPDNVDVQVERGMLTIRGETRASEERKERNYLIREQRSGSFSRTLQLPDNVDVDACQATFDNGVLRLVFPKTERAKPRRIQVTGGGSQPAMGSGQTSGQSSGQSGSQTGSQSGGYGGSQTAGSSGSQAGGSASGQAGGSSGGQAGGSSGGQAGGGAAQPGEATPATTGIGTGVPPRASEAERGPSDRSAPNAGATGPGPGASMAD